MIAQCNRVTHTPARSITIEFRSGPYIQYIDSQLVLTVSISGGELNLSIRAFFSMHYARLTQRRIDAIIRTMPEIINIKPYDLSYVIKDSDLDAWVFRTQAFLKESNKSESSND